MLAFVTGKTREDNNRCNNNDELLITTNEAYGLRPRSVAHRLVMALSLITEGVPDTTLDVGS